MMMKLPVRILLIILCAAMILILPFAVSSPNLLNDVKTELMNDGEEVIDFGRLLFSSAKAEEAEDENSLEVEEVIEGELSVSPEWALPLDFTPGQEPKEEAFGENTYEDDSIRVKLEEQSMEDGTKIFIAHVQIAALLHRGGDPLVACGLPPVGKRQPHHVGHPQQDPVFQPEAAVVDLLFHHALQ